MIAANGRGVSIAEIKKYLNYKLHAISGCLVSHSHGDHAKAARDVMKAGIDLYTAKETAEALNLSGHRLNIIEPLKQFEIEDWKILPFPLQHDVVNLGFLLQKDNEKILYAIDTNYVKYKFTGLTKILLGCNYDVDILKGRMWRNELTHEVGKRTLKNHMSIKTCLKLLKANDLSKVTGIFLLHLSDGNSNEKQFKEAVQRLTGKLVTVG